jgi:tetratricopeptide (TPR) repeat protein/CHAT domain-containing protein
MATLPCTTRRSPTKAQRLFDEGRSLVRQGQCLAALDPLRRVLQQWQGKRARVRSLAECHTEIGWALQRTYRPDEALTHLEEALRLFEGVDGAEREQATCLRRIGQALGDLAHYDAALSRQEQALALLRRLPDTARDQGSCHTNVGVLLSLLGRNEEAIREHEEALALHRSTPGTEVDQAKCHANIGDCLRQLQRPAEALTRLEAALALLQGVPHTEFLQALTCERVGLAQWEMGRYEAAIDTLQAAMTLLHQIPGTDRARANNHAKVGSVLTFLGRHAESMQQHAQALALYRGCPGTEREQAWCCLRIGRSLIGLARHEEALQHLEHALAFLQPIPGTAREQAACIQVIGQVLVELGRGREARAKYDEALALLEVSQAPDLDRAVSHRLTAEALRRGGQPEAALERFAQALALYQPEQDREELWQAYYGVGQAHEARGDPDRAVVAYVTATEFLEGLRDDLMANANKLAFFQEKAPVYGRLIALLLDERIAEPQQVEPRLARWGDTREAIALAFAEAAKARMVSDLLREKAALGSWLLALGESRPVPTKSQELRAKSGSEATMRRLTEEISRLCAELQMLGSDPDASGRSLRERIQALELERDILEARMKRAAPRERLGRSFPRLAEIQNLLEADTALLEYTLLPAPGPAAPSSQLPAPGKEGSPLPQPGAGSREPGAGVQRLVLWIVTRRELRAFRFSLPAPTRCEGTPPAPTLAQMVRRLRLQPSRLSLEERVRLFRYPMERRLQTQGKLSVREHQRAGRLLTEALLPREAQECLAAAGVRQLVIVPDGILHHVPFAALILREDPETATPPRYEACHYLIHDYAVACVPSAVALEALRRAAEQRARRPDQRRSLLAFADPMVASLPARSTEHEARRGSTKGRAASSPASCSVLRASCSERRLPATADEARAVAALFPKSVIHETPGIEGVREGHSPPQSEVYLGRAATKEQVQSMKLDEFRYLIFATHAHIDEENPMRSCIRLTPTERDSGFLQAHEIFGLELDAELVTLSACQSGLGRLACGEGDRGPLHRILLCWGTVPGNEPLEGDR